MKQRSIIILLIVLLAGAGFLLYRLKPKAPFEPIPLPKEEIQFQDFNMKIESPVFENQEEIPSKYTCDGQDINPPLEFSEIPERTKSLALIMDDPDAPMGTWVHWILWNISPERREISENSLPPGAIEGKNSWGRIGYGGPCPPSGSHRYFFKLYALDTQLELSSQADKAELEKAMEGHILEKAELIGLYSRQ
jgi:hypothetical protein